MTATIEYFGKKKRVEFGDLRPGIKFTYNTIEHTKCRPFKEANVLRADFQLCYFMDDELVAVEHKALTTYIDAVSPGKVVEHVSLGELIVGHSDDGGNIHCYRTCTSGCETVFPRTLVTVVGELKVGDACPF